MELKGNTVYFSKEPIDVGNAIPLPEDKYSSPVLVGDDPITFTVRSSKKFIQWIKQSHREHSRFMKQIVLLKQNPKHHEAIFRCLRYGNKIPRKYKRLYKDVIKRMEMSWQR